MENYSTSRKVVIESLMKEIGHVATKEKSLNLGIAQF